MDELDRYSGKGIKICCGLESGQHFYLGHLSGKNNALDKEGRNCSSVRKLMRILFLKKRVGLG